MSYNTHCIIFHKTGLFFTAVRFSSLLCLNNYTYTFTDSLLHCMPSVVLHKLLFFNSTLHIAVQLKERR